MEFAQKNYRRELPQDPEISLLDIDLDKNKTLIQNDTCIPIFISALFITAHAWKQLKCKSIYVR